MIQHPPVHHTNTMTYTPSPTPLCCADLLTTTNDTKSPPPFSVGRHQAAEHTLYSYGTVHMHMNGRRTRLRAHSPPQHPLLLQQQLPMRGQGAPQQYWALHDTQPIPRCMQPQQCCPWWRQQHPVQPPAGTQLPPPPNPSLSPKCHTHKSHLHTYTCPMVCLHGRRHHHQAQARPSTFPHLHAPDHRNSG
jgi:hypothetical protein